MAQSPLHSTQVQTRVGRLAAVIASVAGRVWMSATHGLARLWRGITRRVGFAVEPIPRRPLHERRHRPATPGTPRATRQELRLVRDCEAFFSGRYPTRLPRRLRWQWAWVNTLAHGGRPEIEGLASRRPRRRNGAGVFAAGELLRALDRDGWDLGWFQQRFLVPLELDCMSAKGRGPVTTVGGVLDALHEARPDRKQTHPQRAAGEG